MSHDTIEVFAVAFLLALAITFMWIFNLAYVGGGTTTVGIDWYGEAEAELLLLTLVVWPTISVALYRWTR
ncbi:hypothetical protein OSG_eHP18_00110 [environmental Halophage eHP-18]|nr:hypothetical protein OSG_eHP17_00020 [environmental Halophage eHP-17]AFH22179.1 hypothetical protein OSG_eHP18_00110 [environmental Halophage eHP-18]AFH22707.1 hypothetical protein OSG_eHP33_00020 [environmental Halophage eHP-33]